MRFNLFRKRRSLKSYAPPRKQYKNPFFTRENFSDILFRTLKVHYGIIVLILFGFLYLFFFSEIFQISLIEVDGAEKISHKKIEEFVQDRLQKSRFIIFSQSNYFFFDQKTARQEVKKQIQQELALERFSLQKKFPRKIAVRIAEVKPSVAWLTDENYYYIDKNGIVAQKTAQEDLNPDFPLIEDVNKLNILPQESIISPKVLAQIPTIKKELELLDLTIDRYLTPEVVCPVPVIKDANLNTNDNVNSRLEIIEENKNGNENENIDVALDDCDLKEKLKINPELDVQIKDSYRIYFDTSRDIGEQTKTLDLVLKTKLKGKSNISYIDLRFENRVYYK